MGFLDLFRIFLGPDRLLPPGSHDSRFLFFPSSSPTRQRGKLLLNHEPFDLAVLLDQLRGIMLVETQAKGIGFHIFINREVTLKLLKRTGAEGFSAIDGEAAIKLMAEQKFDLILMDIHLPRMNGFEVTERIRNGDELATPRDVPILAVTANALEGDRDRCIKGGMNDYLAKPVRAAEVQEMLRKYLA